MRNKPSFFVAFAPLFAYLASAAAQAAPASPSCPKLVNAELKRLNMGSVDHPNAQTSKTKLSDGSTIYSSSVNGLPFRAVSVTPALSGNDGEIMVDTSFLSTSSTTILKFDAQCQIKKVSVTRLNSAAIGLAGNVAFTIEPQSCASTQAAFDALNTRVAASSAAGYWGSPLPSVITASLEELKYCEVYFPATSKKSASKSATPASVAPRTPSSSSAAP